MVRRIDYAQVPEAACCEELRTHEVSWDGPPNQRWAIYTGYVSRGFTWVGLREDWTDEERQHGDMRR